MNSKNKEIIGGIYTDVSNKFQRGVLKGMSRTLKANMHDAGVVEKITEGKQIGNVMPSTNRDNPNQGRVYDKDGLAPTINCMGGGNREPMIVASRGRNPNNSSYRTPGSPTEQRLEPNSEGICNCITTVMKDNMVLENKRISPNRTHNMSNTRIYNIWCLMKRRCNSPKAPNYKYYGGRGIKVCSEWNNSFESFNEWAIKNGYTEELSLDRIDNDKDYSPNNCKWATHTEQVNNRRNYGETEYYGIVRDNTGYRAQVTVNGKKKYIAHSVDDIEYLVNERNKYINEHNLPNKKNVLEPKKKGQISSNGSQCGTVYSEDGLSPTLTAGTHGYAMGHVMVKQATKDGYIECKLGGVADLSYPDSKTRRGRVQDKGDTCPTLTAAETGICRIEGVKENGTEECGYRIRKLCPIETWRLMGFTDEDFYKAEKVNSNSQLYRQAGNSIVVNVLEAIFKQMF